MSLFAFSAVQTEVCQKIINGLSQECDESFSRHVSIVSQDCFYKSLNPSEKAQADQGEYNFDHPGELCGVSDPRMIIEQHSTWCGT